MRRPGKSRGEFDCLTNVISNEVRNLLFLQDKYRFLPMVEMTKSTAKLKTQQFIYKLRSQEIGRHVIF